MESFFFSLFSPRFSGCESERLLFLFLGCSSNSFPASNTSSQWLDWTRIWYFLSSNLFPWLFICSSWSFLRFFLIHLFVLIHSRKRSRSVSSELSNSARLLLLLPLPPPSLDPAALLLMFPWSVLLVVFLFPSSCSCLFLSGFSLVSFNVFV